MNVEDIRGYGENYDINFPVGLRVLAVDDDLICLKLLETMLRKCQYHVTTSSQARMALKLLRENKDGFDLVISDVHMPDMDGFKLLELVGLELDIPVIMLSANSDPKLVLKGVTHGACDYLVKPVRLEELKNIWQHVIRKKKFRLQQDHQNGEVCESPISDTSDQKDKLNRKRKDDEDSGNDDDDPVTQKKPRVVWSIELHQKFVAAVNQLGIERAVPKKILDLMNIEGLTRENVASHLQKYRLYLKKISPLATQHDNMRAAAGLDDYRYVRNYSSDFVGDFRTFSGTGRLPNAVLSPYTTSGMLGRLNGSANSNLRNLTPPSLMQPTHSQNLSNSVTTLGKTRPALSTSTQNPFYFQGNLSSLEFNNFQKGVENFDVKASNLNTFNLESFSAEINGFTNLPDNFQLPVDSVRETNASNGCFLPLENGNEKSVSETRVRANENFPMELPKWQGGFDSFEDMMNTVLKREQDGTLLNCDFGNDDYAFGEVV